MDTFRNFLLPILTLLIAILSLFTDTKQIKSIQGLFKDVRVLILIVLIVLSSVFTVYYSNSEAKEAKKTIEERDNTISRLFELTQKVDKNINDYFEELYLKLESYGVSDVQNITLSKIYEIKAADIKRNDIISKTKNNYREKINIKYFQKDIDGNIVLNALKELEFNLIRANPKISNGETNAIYYGKNVDIESIKLVALTLIRAGVDIRIVKPFLSDNGREYQIQIVHSTKAVDNSSYNVEMINKLKK